MSRLNVPSPEDVPDGAKGILDNIGAQFGFVPNMFKTLASNPTVLDVVMTLQSTSSRVLDAKTRHTIALAVSQANGCDYCLAIHTYVSSELGGMSSDDISLARAGSSIDPRRAAVARFAQQVVASRGQVSDADLAAVRGAGYTDPQILAIVTVTVQVLLTNFINNVNQTDIDIPTVSPAGTPG
ncbi:MULTISPECIES: carboxymuconolactone decarboxylase family protein [unclassified Streptomyces]|uniref:carboxymuconolactone decarboxylase family protein n=1 Tax=unclassified Streptomyces TaxID=2593676 RepID=UPI0004C7965B|nr:MULTISPECIES: peroxidase-related enzyme [unclassified Streptomyces]KOV71359.1 alkylhydroperoxidase [Streptomyces sp. NRRL WC-3723]